jgi:dTMP kinase
VKRSGLFIVIDGSDGTGKKTQHQRLLERLETEGIPSKAVDFPQYGQPSAYFVQQYLDGNYGSLDDVSPEQASLFYAVDRFEARKDIDEALSRGEVVVANRFTASNMGHQGAKVADTRKREELIRWIDNLEHNILQIPRPDTNFILTIPHGLAQANIDNRAIKDDRKHDLHEADPDFMRRSIDIYDELSQIFPGSFVLIDSARDESTMKSVDEIHQVIWREVTGRLKVGVRG